MHSDHFIMQTRRSPNAGVYPAIICRMCKETVITGNPTLTNILVATQKHECEGNNATS